MISILQAPEIGWRGWTWLGHRVDLKGKHTQKQLTLRNIHFYYRKQIEDVKESQEDVPDLLGSIMKPTDPVKDGLGPQLGRIVQNQSIQIQKHKIKDARKKSWILARGQRRLLAQ